MTQLDLLWAFQTADAEADSVAQSIKQSPKRQKLLKLRDYIRDQQESLLALENEVMAMSDRMDALKDAISMADDQLKQLQKRIQDESIDTSAQIHQFITEAEKLNSTLNDYDLEARRVRKNVAASSPRKSLTSCGSNMTRNLRKSQRCSTGCACWRMRKRKTSSLNT
jgi:predicted  nucleic acid-binding Zn-ribbon protein